MILMEDSVWNRQNNTVKASISLTVPLLIISIFFLLFDIIVRRWALDVYEFWMKLWTRFYRKKQMKKNAVVKKKPKRHKKNPTVKATKHKKEKQPEQRETLDMNQLLIKKKERK